MRVRTVDTMVLEAFEEKNIAIYSGRNEIKTLLWYIGQLIHTAYRIGLEQNIENRLEKKKSE